MNRDDIFKALLPSALPLVITTVGLFIGLKVNAAVTASKLEEISEKFRAVNVYVAGVDEKKVSRREFSMLYDLVRETNNDVKELLKKQ